MKNFMIVIYILLAGALCYVTYFGRIKPHMDEFNRLKRDQVYTDTTYLWKKGGTSTFGPKGFNNPMIDYDLRSWDVGKNWYLVNTDSNQFKIVGLVDTIYPGLIEHLESWDRMTEYVTKHGPIKLSDPEGLKVLNDLGFTVKKEIKTKN